MICTSSLQRPTSLKRMVSNSHDSMLQCVVYMCIYKYKYIHTLFVQLLPASDDSVLVSRAINLNIDGITLKPAGKHTHKERGVYLHIYTAHFSS